MKSLRKTGTEANLTVVEPAESMTPDGSRQRALSLYGNKARLSVLTTLRQRGAGSPSQRYEEREGKRSHAGPKGRRKRSLLEMTVRGGNPKKSPKPSRTRK